MDHTFATPFVDPYYDDRNSFYIFAPAKVLDSLNAVLSPTSSLRHTYFPPTFELLEGIKEFHTVKPGDEIKVGETRIRTYSLCHPGECLAYRIEYEGKSFVVATDHEHLQRPDLSLAEFARNADVFYVDAQYVDAEYEGRASIADEPPASRRGWDIARSRRCSLRRSPRKSSKCI